MRRYHVGPTRFDNMPDETNKGEVPMGKTVDANKVCIPVNGGSGQTMSGLPAVYRCPSCSFVASQVEMLEFYRPTVMNHITGCQGKKNQSEEKMVGKDTLPNYSAQAGKLAPQKWNFFLDRWKTFLRQQSTTFSQTRINATITSCFP